MRLIRIQPDGSLSLVQYIDNKPIPPYAILSHTWLLAEDEVTFKDMKKGRGLEKKGYAKITFCAKQAQRDGLKYIWIDTCCIDKSQGPELNEAIVSMFSWYRDATICYVYLADVQSDIRDTPSMETAVRRSRWFTRGWTLQELLAPSVVQFHNQTEECLGNRDSLRDLIAECTNIPTSALDGAALSRFQAEERLSWMKGRQTARCEDKIYALWGIFDVVLTPIYGEGYEKALGRFQQEIQRISEEQNREIQRLEMRRIEQSQHRIRKSSSALGFPGCGSFEERVRIDDGLSDPYDIPMELCKSPNDLLRLLEYRFNIEQLPGLLQVKRRHILLWDWNETRELTGKSWTSATMHQKAIKVSFVMGTWTGPPKNRCMRCRKPRTNGTSIMVVEECKSCRLAVRWVEPDYLPYEPEDHTFTWDKDAYRNYRANLPASPSNTSKRPKEVFDADQKVETSNTAISPPIELVCRRLTVKFEPCIYFVYRYVFCRCVIWRSTPSRIVTETTILRHADCPRHNKSGNRFRDYGTYSSCDTDPYFEQFGGYTLFWALLCTRFPVLFERLGGANAISKQEYIEGYLALSEKPPDWVEKLAEDYWFDVLETRKLQYRTFPPGVKIKRAERGIDTKSVEEEDTDDGCTDFFQKQFSESVMGTEIRDIMSKRWTGQPHWKLKR